MEKKGIYLSRLRFADGRPVVIERHYFPQIYPLPLDETLDNKLPARIFEGKTPGGGGPLCISTQVMNGERFKLQITQGITL